MPLGDVKLTVCVAGDYLAYELMRFTLREIVRAHREDPFAVSAADAAEISEACLTKVEELEGAHVA